MSEESVKYWLKLLKTNHAVFSVMAGFVVMLLVGLTIFSVMWFKQLSPPTQVAQTSPTESQMTETTYVVQPGDSSWSLAEEFLGDGYRYIEIEQVNNLTHNQYLEIGQKLIIPDGEKSEKTNKVQEQEQKVALPIKSDHQGTPYIIQPGDSLWKIAKEHYGEGLLWSKVYHHNPQLGPDPDLIYPEAEITLPPPQLL